MRTTPPPFVTRVVTHLVALFFGLGLLASLAILSLPDDAEAGVGTVTVLAGTNPQHALAKDREGYVQFSVVFSGSYTSAGFAKTRASMAASLKCRSIREVTVPLQITEDGYMVTYDNDDQTFYLIEPYLDPTSTSDTDVATTGGDYEFRYEPRTRTLTSSTVRVQAFCLQPY